MKKISMDINPKVDISEFRKLVGFISEYITAYALEGTTLTVEVSDEADATKIKEDIVKLSEGFISKSDVEREIFSNINEREYKQETKASIHHFDDGMVGLSDQALFLYRHFERTFASFAEHIEMPKKIEVAEKLYPVLLPIKSYKKTGYLNNSPQYAMFCCSACENLKILEGMKDIEGNEYMGILGQPEYALSPSACFHTYIEYENQVLPEKKIMTFTQSVFRNEGRFNFADFGRMRDYHVREIVFIGDQTFVLEVRKAILDMAIQLMIELDLAGNVTIASDPFIIPKMQKYKKVQVLDESKYEMHLNYDKKGQLSVASFNLHGTAFTYPFNIKVDGCEDTVTGCVGFGLERWVMAFLNQYGENINQWPDKLKEEYKNGRC